MKFGKKFLGVIVATSLVFGTSITAFAATNNDVITALTSAGANASTISMATSYLNSHSSISSSSLNSAVTDIKAVQAMGVTSLAQFSALSATDKAIVAADIKAAASSLGITITKNANGTFTATDSTGAVLETIGANGTTVATTTGVAGQSAVTGKAGNTTATNYGNLLALGAIIAAAGAGALAISKKKEILA